MFSIDNIISAVCCCNDGRINGSFPHRELFRHWYEAFRVSLINVIALSTYLHFPLIIVG